MRFDERIISLKDNKKCVLCPATADYAEQMIAYMKATAAETPFLLRYPDEVTYTIEGEKEILNRLLEDETCVMMMGLVDGNVAGNCSINGLGNKRKIRHRCTMAIALEKAYWHMGIGTAMVEYVTELAREIGYEQIELEVIEGNAGAMRLYEKNGFVVTGKQVDAMKYDDGTYRDMFVMCKKL